MRQRQKVYALEQFDFKDLVNRYMAKSASSLGTVEGIYSVSSIVIRKGKGILASEEKEKIVDRKENYSKVAIIRDDGSGNREYLEVSLDKEYLPSYSVVGEFSGLSEGNLLVYKHFESRGRSDSYTISYDKAKDILEGIRTESNGNFTYTYKLTYLKLAPKSAR